MINQPFVVFWNNAERERGSLAQAEIREFSIAREPHRRQQIAQQRDAPAWKTLVKQLADSSDIYATTNQLSRDFERAHGCIRILKRTGVGRDRRVKIFCDGRRDWEFLVG